MRPYLVGILALSATACGADRAFAPPVTPVAEARSSERLTFRSFDGLLIIDGVRYETGSDQERALAAITPDRIARVEVVKGGFAERLGVMDGRGVIIVTLKKSPVEGS